MSETEKTAELDLSSLISVGTSFLEGNNSEKGIEAVTKLASQAGWKVEEYPKVSSDVGRFILKNGEKRIDLFTKHVDDCVTLYWFLHELSWGENTRRAQSSPDPFKFLNERVEDIAKTDIAIADQIPDAEIRDYITQKRQDVLEKLRSDPKFRKDAIDRLLRH